MTIFTRSNHFLTFGLPFLVVITAATYGLAHMSQVRVDFHEKKLKSVSKQEELKLDEGRKKVNLQEEYFKLTKDKDMDAWDFVRVERPKGVAEPVFENQGRK
ncbi:cytochrome c oxidase assembly protein COX16-domain-containing protein [Chytridium lagenaria]|nr:cytochrome c oxidase assembly protein COX16-domain-containing protein [Chytridium lagenaria]